MEQENTFLGEAGVALHDTCGKNDELAHVSARGQEEEGKDVMHSREDSSWATHS